MKKPVPIPHTLRLDREKKIEKMAAALVNAQQEAKVDLGDARLVYAWLDECPEFSDGEILAFAEPALERARARAQREANLDNVACTIGVAFAGAAMFFGWIGYAGEAQAAILSHAGVDAGGDVWLGIVCLIVGLYLGHGIGWLQYGRRLKVCAPYPDEDDRGMGAFDYRNAGQ